MFNTSTDINRTEIIYPGTTGLRQHRRYQHFGHELSEEFATFVSVCFILIIIVALTCNITLITTISTTRSLHNNVNFFIGHMAVADIMTAVGTIPFDVEFMLRGYFSRGIVACGVMQVCNLWSLIQII